MMSPPGVKGFVGGELDIEQIPFHEVEIKQKDLLPVFDHFHSIKSSWDDRGLWGGAYPNVSSFGLHHVRDKVTEESVICHSKPASVSSTESSDGGSWRRIENKLDLDQMNAGKAIKPPNGNIVNTLEQETRGSVNVESPILKPLAFVYLPSEHSKKTDSHVDDSVKTDTPSGRGVTAEAALTSDACGIRADPILTANYFDSAMNTSAEGSSPSRLENLVDFEPFFQEGYCKALDLDAADSSGKPCQTENPEADDEDDELLGGMFSFSEEG